MPFYDKNIEFKDEKFYIVKNVQMNHEKVVPYIAKKIETFYSNTNLNVSRLKVNDTCYVFVNKIKRMLPELQMTKLDFKKEQ